MLLRSLATWLNGSTCSCFLKIAVSDWASFSRWYLGLGIPRLIEKLNEDQCMEDWEGGREFTTLTEGSYRTLKFRFSWLKKLAKILSKYLQHTFVCIHGEWSAPHTHASTWPWPRWSTIWICLKFGLFFFFLRLVKQSRYLLVRRLNPFWGCGTWEHEWSWHCKLGPIRHGESELSSWWSCVQRTILGREGLSLRCGMHVRRGSIQLGVSSRALPATCCW